MTEARKTAAKKTAVKKTTVAPTKTEEADLQKAADTLQTAVDAARKAGLTVKARWSFESKDGGTVNGRS